MLTLNFRFALPLALLVLPACPLSEKVGDNHSEPSGTDAASSGTDPGDGTSSGTLTPEPTTTESSDSTVTESSGSTTVMGGGPPSECGPPCTETWTHVGDLELGSSNISTDEFKCMTRVVGDLGIYDLDQQQLSGLRNLVSVEGNLFILSETLTDLSPFSCLEDVTLQIQLGNAPKLSDVSGFSALRHTGRFIMQYTSATAVPTFSPEFSGLGLAEITGNDALVDLAGIASWKPGDTGIWAIIRDNSGLKSVAGLQPLLALNPAQSSVTLTNLPALESLAGLDGLTELNWIDLDFLPLIPDLAPLGQLKTVGFLDLSGMPLVEDLQPLSQLETAGRLTIGSCVQFDLGSGMQGLTSLAGLSSLTTLEELAVYDNENLVTLAGADKLTSITKTWAEINNPALDPAAVDAFVEQVGQGPCSSDDRACVCYDPEESETDGV